MDNIFEILIYLFIIISFISSFFKKKKPDVKQGRQTPEPQPQSQTQAKTSEQEEYDLLKEIEKMFKMETPSSEKAEDRNFEKGEERFEPASEHLETTDWQKPVPSEHKYESWEEKNRKAEEKRKAVNQKIVKQAEIFEKHLEKKHTARIDYRQKVVEKFKNPKSLKEYIIFNEVLGKPKALQE